MPVVDREKSVDPSTEVVAGSLTGALWVAVLTSLIHFGGLVALDLILQPAPPRIYSFLAATMGNGLFLPVANAGWYLIRAHLPRSRAGIAAGLTVGLLAGAAMLFSQLIWIVDPQPYDTWKLMEAHHFTAMGIYNLVISTAVFSIGGYWLGDVLG